VHPGRGSANEPSIGGAELALDGKLFSLLNGIYSKSETDCDIEIAFNSSADGKQTNPCRDLIVSYLRKPGLPTGREIAIRLEKVTTRRSGLGLLFLIAGEEGAAQKFVISRFPTDNAILAEENRHQLTVEFLERVFMKSATAYKAAAYTDRSLSAGFWSGRATDKQINSREINVSNYWILDFLASDFRTTAAAGTRRLAICLKSALTSSDSLSVKGEITAAVTLAKNLAGQRTSIADFIDKFGLSKKAAQLITAVLSNPGLLNERFEFDPHEFSGQLPYRTVELDSGGILTAETDKFDHVFKKQIVDRASQRVRFSTEGRIANERLKKSTR
jgi:hypothetical protein